METKREIKKWIDANPTELIQTICMLCSGFGTIVIIIIWSLLSGCSVDISALRSEEVSDCHGPKNIDRAKWLLACIENANPKSDEEPEDWLWICESMSKSFCPVKRRYYIKTNPNIYCDSISKHHKYYFLCEEVEKSG